MNLDDIFSEKPAKAKKPIKDKNPDAITRWRELRWRCRTDLMYLAHLLGYKDLNEKTHRPVINHLQQVPAPLNTVQAKEHDKFVNGKWEYKPLVPEMHLLPGTRRMLLLDARGACKSTINCVCHTIQWIINYPDIALLLVQSNLDKIKLVVGEVKSHFQLNETFRALFPEFCPQKKIADWGTQDTFTVDCRKKFRKEPTVTGLSLGARVAGLHYHVMKFSDIVEEDNSKTPEQIASVAASFTLFHNLLDRPDYWIDVEGTRYHFADLYGKLIMANDERKKRGEEPEWTVFVRGAYLKDTENPKFTPEELDLPDKLDERGKPISYWPERFTVEFLERERTNPASIDAGVIFACQRLNNPLDVKDTRRPFPMDKFTTISRADFLKVPIAYRTVTVDTADTINKRSNYTAITVGAWSQSGKLYVENIIHGKFLPEEIIFHLFNLMRQVRSPSEQPRQIFIEETAFVRGLMASINRTQDTGLLYIPEHLREKYGRSTSTNGIRLPITTIKRETNISKVERIMNTLQPWYVKGDLIFLEDIPHLEYTRHEFNRFPQFHTDDIIDSVADQFQHKDWFGRLTPRPTKLQIHQQTLEEFLGIADPYGPFASESDTHNIPTPFNHPRTGAL